jgi:hypothetical protein
VGRLVEPSVVPVVADVLEGVAVERALFVGGERPLEQRRRVDGALADRLDERGDSSRSRERTRSTVESGRYGSLNSPTA